MQPIKGEHYQINFSPHNGYYSSKPNPLPSLIKRATLNVDFHAYDDPRDLIKVLTDFVTNLPHDAEEPHMEIYVEDSYSYCTLTARLVATPEEEEEFKQEHFDRIKSYKERELKTLKDLLKKKNAGYFQELGY